MRAPVPPVREIATLSEIANRFLTRPKFCGRVVDAKGQMGRRDALHDLKGFLSSEEQLLVSLGLRHHAAPPACVTPTTAAKRFFPVRPGQ